MRVALTPIYILHIRPYRDSSAILECLSSEYGWVSLLARGAKRPRSRMIGHIQPFIPLQCGWVGRSELKTLTQIEAENLYPRLTGDKIALGLYLNEVILRLLQRQDPHPQLFYAYDKAIRALSIEACSKQAQLILRDFELCLLAELGYGLDLTHDGRTKDKIVPELLYSYDPMVGIYEVSAMLSSTNKVAVSGASLIAFHHREITSDTQLREIKNLMRSILSHYLGDKPLHSRKLFQTVKE
ncbi:MAG: DNA repair protein RecO [Candidatus Berkiellales bacterium]